MRIPEDKVEEIIGTSDLVDLVGEYVQLKKRSGQYFGLCPFHNEKTPSFTVNPRLGIFKCFGCGEGGNAAHFLMKMENLGFIESLKELAKKNSIPWPESDEEEKVSNALESVYHALKMAARFYYTQMVETEAGQSTALAYLTGRGLTPKTIRSFGLGYSPAGWDNLLKHGETSHVKTQHLKDAGLIIPNKQGNGFYDRFRHRAMFPIFSHIGKIIGFGARLLEKADDQPKYLNSPETVVYSKNKVLYGLFQSKQEIRRSEVGILVEGYMDVISLHQAGIKNVVASSGTALTHDQVKALGRYAKTVILIYDADAAGARAMLRGVDRVLAGGLIVNLVTLPDGADPDSFVQQFGKEAFLTFLDKNKADFVTFMKAQAESNNKLTTPEDLLQLVQQIAVSISHVQNNITQEGYLRLASKTLDVPESDIRLEVEKAQRTLRRQEQSEARREKRHSERQHQANQSNNNQNYDRQSSENRSFDDDRYDIGQEDPEDYGFDRNQSTQQGQRRSNQPQKTSKPRPEELLLIRLMLEEGAPLVQLIMGHMALNEFTDGPAQLAIQHILTLFNEGDMRKERFFLTLQDEAVRNLAIAAMVDQHEASEKWQEKTSKSLAELRGDPIEAAKSAMTLLKLDHVDQTLHNHQQKIYRAKQNGTDLTELLHEMTKLHLLKKQIKQQAFLSWNNDNG